MAPEPVIDTGPEVARLEQMETSSVKINPYQSNPANVFALSLRELFEPASVPRLFRVAGRELESVEMTEKQSETAAGNKKILFEGFSSGLVWRATGANSRKPELENSVRGKRVGRRV